MLSNYLLNIFFCINIFLVQSERIYLIRENGEIRLQNGLIDKSENNSLWLSTADYKNDINKTGFAYFEVEGNPMLEDYVQAHSVGYIEGKVTHDLIYSQWFNTVNYFKTTNNETIIKSVDIFLEENTKWVLHQVEVNKHDSYWYHVGLFYTQLNGMYVGYNSNHETKGRSLSFIDFLWLTMFYDLTEMYGILGSEHIYNGHCSALIKILPDNKDIYIGHNSWTWYSCMLRVKKKYIFHYNKSLNERERIPGFQTAFSSYPGSITSMDDYYLISSGLSTTETTNDVFNISLRSSMDPKNLVWENVRSMVANRLANSGQTWSDIFALYNSGTYNNQWMIFDYKKFKPGRPLGNGAFWVAEQMPFKVVAKDLTHVLVSKGYWGSYNIPYDEEIFNITGYRDKLERYGNWFSHEDAPRAKILRRDHVRIVDMKSFMELMRSNNYEHDPFARCECDPPYSAAGAIACRNDLNPINGTYQLKTQGHSSVGAIDAKITNSSLFLKLQFIGVSGPSTGTDGRLPIFVWSQSNLSMPHMSHPDIWNFKPVLHKWSL